MPRARGLPILGSLGSLVCLATLFVAGHAHADGPYEGTWTSSATHMDVAIHSWGDDCGPRPQSLTQPSSGNMPISQDGDNLTLHGRRTTRTNTCWSENRAVHLVSTSVQGGNWRTICRTSPDDPRGETGTYTLRAIGGDQLSRTDVSEYDWSINGSHCTATVTETQTYNRVRDATPVVVTPPPPPDTHPACTPGAAAHVALRPSNATVQPGERTCFHARVTDASGCPLGNAPVTWALDKPPGLRGELTDGCFHAGDTAAEAEGTFRITAMSGALHDAATVVVHTEDLSDLIAHRSDTTNATTSTADATTSEASQVAARADGGGSHTSLVAPLVGGGVALLLVLAVVLVLLAGRKKKPTARASMPIATSPSSPNAPAQLGATPPTAPAASAQQAPPSRLVCPSCHNEFPGDTLFCPNDGAHLVAAANAPSTAAPAQGMICPTCRRGFPADAKFCPADSEELVPYAMFVAGHRAKEQVGPTKICPQCGGRYGAGTTFCGKDGSELVLVN